MVRALSSAAWTAATHSVVPYSTQVVMIEAKPTSLPPTEMLTSVVVALSAES